MAPGGATEGDADGLCAYEGCGGFEGIRQEEGQDAEGERLSDRCSRGEHEPCRAERIGCRHDNEDDRDVEREGSAELRGALLKQQTQQTRQQRADKKADQKPARRAEENPQPTLKAREDRQTDCSEHQVAPDGNQSLLGRQDQDDQDEHERLQRKGNWAYGNLYRGTHCEQGDGETT